MTEIPQAQPDRKQNVFERIAGVLFAPAETFQNIVRHPDIVAPLVLIIIIGFISTAVVMPKFDLSTTLEQQAEQMRKRDPDMSDEQLAQIEKWTAASTKLTFWILPLLAVIWYVIMAGVLLFAFRLMGGEGTFKQAFSVTLYAWIPMVLWGILSTIISLARGSYDPVQLPSIVKTHAAFFVDMKEQPILFALLSSFDLFTIWTIVLLIFGFAAMARMSKAKAATIVISLWAVVILLKMGLAALNA